MSLLENYDFNVKMFLDNHTAVGTADTTIRNYTVRLRYFREFLEQRINSGESGLITAADIRAWRDQLLQTSKPSTVRQYMVEIKAFFEQCLDPVMEYRQITAHIEGKSLNPVSARLFPKTHDAEPYDKILLEGDLKKLWANLPPYGNRSAAVTWARNYSIVMLLIDSKIRNAELLDLRLSDVDFERSEIAVRNGKGNKFRYVHITDISISAIKLYLLSGLRPAYCTESDYLFGTEAVKGIGIGEGGGSLRKGEHWHRGTAQWLTQLVERHVYNVTGKHGFRTHSLRHAGAALDLNAGERLERIQAELGHTSVKTTERYTDRLKSVSRAAQSEEVVNMREFWAEENMRKLKEKTEEKTEISAIS